MEPIKKELRFSVRDKMVLYNMDARKTRQKRMDTIGSLRILLARTISRFRKLKNREGLAPFQIYSLRKLKKYLN